MRSSKATARTCFAFPPRFPTAALASLSSDCPPPAVGSRGRGGPHGTGPGHQIAFKRPFAPVHPKPNTHSLAGLPAARRPQPVRGNGVRPAATNPVPYQNGANVVTPKMARRREFLQCQFDRTLETRPNEKKNTSLSKKATSFFFSWLYDALRSKGSHSAEARCFLYCSRPILRLGTPGSSRAPHASLEQVTRSAPLKTRLDTRLV